ncbi:MAG: zf-HC2 domain-containing protein [bacterium]
MTCRETRPLLPLFFDGELEARQMRSVALHSTRCTACEEELRELEHLQEAVVSHISALVDEVDLSQVWAGVAPRLSAQTPSWPSRVRGWLEEHRPGWGVRGPAFAALAVAALLTLVLVQPATQSPEPIAAPVAKIDNSAKLDSMQSSVDSVALVTEAETNTTLLWIMDDAKGTVEHAADEWDSLE